MRNRSPRKGYFFERRAPLGGRSTGRGVPGNPGGLSTPIFFLVSPKKKTAVEPSKEKTLFAAQLRARDAPCRAAGRGAKPFCSINAAPTRARAGLSSDFRTQYAVLRSEVIGQRPNLTSCSFRAFRFAKRCRGGRGGGPLWGWFLRRFPPIPRGRWRGRFAARRLAWVGD